MAEEFYTGFCGGAWWINPTRSSSSLSPCSEVGIGLSDHMGSFLWSSNDMVDTKTTTTTATTKSCEKSNNLVSADSSSMVFQSAHKHQQTDSDSGGSSSILMDSTLQKINFCSSSSSSTHWNQALLSSNGRAENNFRTMMIEDLDSQIQKEWRPKIFTSAGDQDFSLDQHPLKSVTTSDNCTGLSAGFPVNSASYGYTSALLQSYLEPHPQLAVQQSIYSNQSITSNYMSTENYGTNISNEQLSPSWPKFDAPILKPSLMPKRQPCGLHICNNTPFWNPSAATGLNDNRPGLLATLFGEKRNSPTITAKCNNEEVRNSGPAAKKGSSEPTFKRPRIDTPSPLPTFKVRKEKIGDRITALQQLVSPFGKTDTASVLHEAIEYIKFLHDQVSVLTVPYMKQGTPIQQQQGSDHKLKDPELPKQDLKTRGLCLVPISSTLFPVTNETTTDFWRPTFGGTFR